MPSRYIIHSTGWKPAQRIADRNRKRVHRTVLGGMSRARRAVNVDAIEKAARDRNAHEVMVHAFSALSIFNTDIASSFPKIMLDILTAVGKTIARESSSIRSLSHSRTARTLTSVGLEALGVRALKKGKFDLAFDAVTPESIAWARRYAAELVTNVSSASRQAIQDLIVQSFAEKITPYATARAIRSVIGLTPAQANAILNLREHLINADGQTILAGSMRIAVPEGGFTDEKLWEKLDRYSDRLLKSRAETIARTETIRAANEGQREVWAQAQAAGLIPASAKKVWIASEDACDECLALASIGPQCDYDPTPREARSMRMLATCGGGLGIGINDPWVVTKEKPEPVIAEPAPEAEAGSFSLDTAREQLAALEDHGNADFRTYYNAKMNPLPMGGDFNPDSLWTSAKEEVTAALMQNMGISNENAFPNAFRTAVANGVEEVVDISSLSSYQPWVGAPKIESYLGKFDPSSDEPIAVIFHHAGKDWILDGNHRLAGRHLGGASTARVIRIGG